MNLDELKKAAEAATPGPWKYYKDDNFIQSEDVRARISDWPVTRSTDVGTDQRNNNAAFIALANPTTILALLKVVDAARVSCSMNFSGGFAAIRYALKELDA